MSALRAMVFPGFPPFKNPRTAMPPAIIRVSIPKLFKVSSTFLAVLNSFKADSGFS